MLPDSSFLLSAFFISRRVGRVWLAQARTQAFQTPPSTCLWVPNGQVGPHPSPKPIALACLPRAMLVQTCVTCAFARFLSENITRANGVIFRAIFAHPQTKPRALNTASTMGWYSGIVVLDVVKGERVIEKLDFNILHVRTFAKCWITLVLLKMC